MCPDAICMMCWPASGVGLIVSVVWTAMRLPIEGWRKILAHGGGDIGPCVPELLQRRCAEAFVKGLSRRIVVRDAHTDPGCPLLVKPARKLSDEFGSNPATPIGGRD